jgi:hypothetical protein
MYIGEGPATSSTVRSRWFGSKQLGAHCVVGGRYRGGKTLARISHNAAGAGSVLAALQWYHGVFRALQYSPGIGGGAKSPIDPFGHDNALRQHAATV